LDFRTLISRLTSLFALKLPGMASKTNSNQS